jgi:hypothetical protein
MSTSATQAGQCSYLNLRATEKGLSELSSKGVRLVFISKNQIESLQIKYGSYAERPILQVITALILVSLGLVGLYLVLCGGIRGLYWGMGFLAFGAIGVFCMYEAVRKGHYLAVKCKGSTRKLIPRGSVSEAEFAKFAVAASALGYSLGGK